MVDKCVNRNENRMGVFVLYPHTMPVSILSSSADKENEPSLATCPERLKVYFTPS